MEQTKEHLLAEIRRCALAGSAFTYLSFLFTALRAIGDALNITHGLELMSWFLLAIFASLYAVVPDMHLMVAKHLLGIEAESKKE